MTLNGAVCMLRVCFEAVMRHRSVNRVCTGHAEMKAVYLER